MKNKLLIAFTLMSCACNPQSGSEETKNDNTTMVYLENKHLNVGINTYAGGRLVDISLIGKKNILQSDSSMWHNKDIKPKVSHKTEFLAYNGHIVWLGPQSEWWVHQDLNKDKKEAAAPWPPDPYLIYSDYNILGKSEQKLVIQSPESPITGIQLTKNYTLTDSNKLVIKVDAKNIRETEVNWDIWFNTRLFGYNKCYVPIENPSDLRLDNPTEGPHDAMAHHIAYGHFYYTPEATDQSSTYRSKAFIYPSKPYIAGFNNNQLLLITFKKEAKEDLHPEQALVEIYSYWNKETGENLLELEHHSAYYNFKPGESHNASETWYIFNYQGNDSAEEHIAFIERMLEKINL